MVTLEDLIARHGLPLASTGDLDRLIAEIGDARFVLVGEASHGTSDYYTWRARLSQRLIDEKGFSFVAVEGDWPDCYRVNQYVRGLTEGEHAFDVLHAFDRWPTWMWANWEIVAFADWLRRRNDSVKESSRAGFYGLDVYSLFESMDEVLKHLRLAHPDLVNQAERAFACFEPFERESQNYAYSTLVLGANCEREVVEVLKDLVANRPNHGRDDPESHFDAEMNGRAALDAERYYKAMVRSDDHSWNVRDTHMMDTLDLLLAHLGPGTKAIVWAHNTHIGDARATDMAAAGMVNIGQLCRERHRGETYTVGFGSYGGGVIAADRWGAPMTRMPVPDAREGSWEDVLHRSLKENGLLLLKGLRGNAHFEARRGHRAIGVVYHPGQERYGNYVPTNLPGRYDAFLFIDRSDPLHPLHLRIAGSNEPPETYPFAI